MLSLTKPALNLLETVGKPVTETVLSEGETIGVSQTVSVAAAVYEAARNAVEFRAEHLVRRAAIERILKRRTLLNINGNGIAEALIRELLWAKYLGNNTVSKKLVPEIEEIIKKHLILREAVLKQFTSKERGLVSNWILEVASCEIEKKLAPNPNREALLNFVYQTLKERVSLPQGNDQKTQSIQIYIATHRGFALSDEPIIRFHLFLSLFPEWPNLKPEAVSTITFQFKAVYQEIEKQLHHPLKDEVRRLVIREVAPFNVIRDLVEEESDKLAKTIENPVVLKEKTREILTTRYQETGAKLRRAAIRSIIYIFLTKMLFALLLEFPFDRWVGKTNWGALAINSLFPPSLMFFLTASLHVPGDENTEKVLNRIKEFVYGDGSTQAKIELNQTKRGRTFDLVFGLVYFLTYILIFGGIIYLLNQFHFNLVSQIIFLFFLSVVSFFAYRVRLITKSYEMKEKEGFFGLVTDFLFLPILRVGQWLSVKLSQINIFMFIFDFIIEAPFKAFFSLIEEWIHFVHLKKEEITT